MTNAKKGFLLVFGLLAVFGVYAPRTKTLSGQPTYLVSPTSHVFLWRDGQALKDAHALVDDGAAKAHPELLEPLIACMVDSGTQATKVSPGVFTSTVLIDEGPSVGCRGDVDNTLLTNARVPAPPSR